MPRDGVAAHSAPKDIAKAHNGVPYDELRARLVECELQVLELRDMLIGADAKWSELEARLGERLLGSDYRVSGQAFHLEQQIAALTVHVDNHLSHIARLEAALAAAATTNRTLALHADALSRVHASTTWRIARILMLPRRIWLRVASRQ
jgi:hypothetical protein